LTLHCKLSHLDPADTYLASVLSGRLQLFTDTESSYYIDRDGTGLTSDTSLTVFEIQGAPSYVSYDMTKDQQRELMVEMKLYREIDYMMPYCTQEHSYWTGTRTGCVSYQH